MGFYMSKRIAGEMLRKRISRGLSELVVIMIAVAIAIPVMFLLQTWLAGQVGKLPELDSVTAAYVSKSISSGKFLVTLTVNNNGNEHVNISSITVIYTSNTTANTIAAQTATPLGNPSLIVDPKSSRTVSFIVSGAAKVNEVIVTIKSLSSNVEKTIRATGS